ncbi:MAG: type II toxin-antitoxin system RelE/ParE family toxin [Clostridiales bacterium]|nr:type II toxin-antitoxin system RelE/ParE family toxin [Clostridiales bacterium]
MKYSILFDRNADKQLRQIDITQQRIIVNWIEKNLRNTDNPRRFGKSLKGNLKDYWRYRIGNYRIIADIDDDKIRIIIINIGHRKDIYK